MDIRTPGRFSCERFRRDGSRCTARTDYHDRWCRQPQCPGFTRPSADAAPESVGAPQGTRTHLREEADHPVPLQIDEIDTVRITQRAVDSFRFHHGGSAAAAQAQLRSMLEDFVLGSARHVISGGRYLRLAREGFVLITDPDMTAVTGYSTVHRERTWAQVKAGVTSRFARARRERHRWNRAMRQPGRPEPGPAFPAESLLAEIDPATIYVSSDTYRRFQKLLNLQECVHENGVDLLRDSISRLKNAGVECVETGPADRQAAASVFDGLRWTFSLDARSVIFVSRAIEPE